MTETKKPRPIYRDKIFIDPEIVSAKYTHADNNVTYYCYRETDKSTLDKVYIPENPEVEFKALMRTDVCFYNLLDLVHDSGKKSKDDQYNRVLYHMKTDKKACIKLTLEEQRRFIELSVLHKMLPGYVSPETVLSDTEGKMVMLLEDLTPSQLYMYLSQYRYLREDPGFVKSILHLHDTIGFDFYAAFVIASRVSIDYTTHHFLTLQRQYGSSDANNVDKVTIPFSTVVGVRRFALRPQDYDTRKVLDTKHGYEASSRIESICKIKYELQPLEFLEPMVKRAFSAMTDEITKKYMDQYKKMRDRIKYKERAKENTANAKCVNSQQ